jgi:hypothetical protein
MPFESLAQNAWAHTAAGKEALGGEAKVKEWEHATNYSHLPEHVKQHEFSKAPYKLARKK